MSSEISVRRVLIKSQTDRQPTDSTHKFTSYFRAPVGKFIDARRKVHMCISSASIPNYAYPISYANSRLYFIVKDLGSGVTSQNYVQLPTNINIQDMTHFAAILQAEMFTQHSLNMTIEFDENRERLKFTSNIGNSEFRFISSRQFEETGIQDSPLPDRANIKFGFIGDYRNDAYVQNDVWYTEGFPSLRRTDKYYISSDVVRDKTVIPSGYISEPILASIPAGPFGTTSVFYPSNEQWHVVSDASIDRINFTILDNDDIPVDLSGGNVVLELKFRYS